MYIYIYHYIPCIVPISSISFQNQSQKQISAESHSLYPCHDIQNCIRINSHDIPRKITIFHGISLRETMAMDESPFPSMIFSPWRTRLLQGSGISKCHVWTRVSRGYVQWHPIIFPLISPFFRAKSSCLICLSSTYGPFSSIFHSYGKNNQR